MKESFQGGCEDSSIGKVLASQVCGPEFNPQILCKKDRHGSNYISVTLVLERQSEMDPLRLVNMHPRLISQHLFTVWEGTCVPWEVDLSYHHVGPSHLIQVIRLHDNSVYLLSHFTGPT